MADSDWSDWAEESSVKLVCLFCDVIAGEWGRILLHMREEHAFDYERAVQGLDFYRQVRFTFGGRQMVPEAGSTPCGSQTDSFKTFGSQKIVLLVLPRITNYKRCSI